MFSMLVKTLKIMDDPLMDVASGIGGSPILARNQGINDANKELGNNLHQKKN